MNKKLIIGLLLIALVVVILVMTKGTVNIWLVDRLFKNAPTSLAMLGFTGVGVIIGLLLK